MDSRWAHDNLFATSTRAGANPVHTCQLCVTLSAIATSCYYDAVANQEPGAANRRGRIDEDVIKAAAAQNFTLRTTASVAFRGVANNRPPVDGENDQVKLVEVPVFETYFDKSPWTLQHKNFKWTESGERHIISRHCCFNQAQVRSHAACPPKLQHRRQFVQQAFAASTATLSTVETVCIWMAPTGYRRTYEPPLPLQQRQSKNTKKSLI